MIKNLSITLPEIGKIKAGTLGEEAISSQGKKFRLPKKLNHFVITTTERDEAGNLVLDTDLMASLKESGKAIIDKDGNLTGIPIRLLYNNIDTNFYTRYACYISGNCACSGDGIKATTRDGREIECPCEKLNPLYKGRDKCKATGRLICIIEGSPVVGAAYVLRSTSINTVKSILGSLAFIQTAASGMLAFLPLHLILKPKTITIPTTGQLSTIYVSSIIYRGSIEQLRNDALGMAKAKTEYLLEIDNIEASARELLDKLEESEQEQKDINEEFFPDTATIDVSIEKKPEPKPPAEPQKEKPAAAKKEKPAVESEPPVEEPLAEPESEPKPESEPAASEPAAAMVITKEQKRKIVTLKKAAKITDPGVWLKLLDPFGVITANDLTKKQADDFIKVLKVPF